MTLRAIQATVERCDRPRATVTWTSALIACAVSVSVVNPAAAQLRPVRNAVAGSPSSRQSRSARVHRQQVGREPFLSSPRGSIRNSLAANSRRQLEEIDVRMSVGDFLLKRLAELGAQYLFGVPGDYNLWFLEQAER